jgi:hypothetical protein
MCLDIDPSSVIHDMLNKKITHVMYYGNTQHSNNLTMLPSFHISLGAPKKEIKVNAINNKFSHLDMVPIVGDIALAPICISKKDNKKSAWIPLNFHWIVEAVTKYPGDSTWKDLNLGNFDSFDHRCDEKTINNKIINQCTFKHLHISLANLTGNPHDSIARPEDCIIDTITS